MTAPTPHVQTEVQLQCAHRSAWASWELQAAQARPAPRFQVMQDASLARNTPESAHSRLNANALAQNAQLTRTSFAIAWPGTLPSKVVMASEAKPPAAQCTCSLYGFEDDRNSIHSKHECIAA